VARKVGQQCHRVIHPLAMTIIAATIARHMERIHRVTIIPATTIIRRIIANHQLTGVVMPPLQPVMHLHILVRCRALPVCCVHFGRWYQFVETFRSWSVILTGRTLYGLPGKLLNSKR